MKLCYSNSFGGAPVVVGDTIPASQTQGGVDVVILGIDEDASLIKGRVNKRHEVFTADELNLEWVDEVNNSVIVHVKSCTYVRRVTFSRARYDELHPDDQLNALLTTLDHEVVSISQCRINYAQRDQPDTYTTLVEYLITLRSPAKNINMSENPREPSIGSFVSMRKHDVSIIIETIPERQPRKAEGIWNIVDQYGEQHAIELDNGRWFVVVPSLT